jgi:uncharacterized protein (UPF0264 family)
MKTPTPKLLVSVRNATEARAALEGGADIVDVKEPPRGPQGAADANTLAEVAAVVAGQRRLSAAMGELSQFDSTAPKDAIGSYTWLKFGLAHCGVATQAWTKWKEAQSRFATSHEWVAVAYADHFNAVSLAPSQLARALHAHYAIFLIDTYEKDGHSILDYLPIDALGQIKRDVSASGAMFAIAGSLRIEQVRNIAQLRPDIVGIRGAACEGGRTGAIVAKKVADFRRALHEATSALADGMQAAR